MLLSPLYGYSFYFHFHNWINITLTSALASFQNNSSYYFFISLDVVVHSSNPAHTSKGVVSWTASEYLWQSRSLISFLFWGYFNFNQNVENGWDPSKQVKRHFFFGFYVRDHVRVCVCLVFDAFLYVSLDAGICRLGLYWYL